MHEIQDIRWGEPKISIPYTAVSSCHRKVYLLEWGEERIDVTNLVATAHKTDKLFFHRAKAFKTLISNRKGGYLCDIDTSLYVHEKFASRVPQNLSLRRRYSTD
jgi:hypothetical protein